MKFILILFLISTLSYATSIENNEDFSVKIPFMFYTSDTGLGGVLYYKNIRYRDNFRKDNELMAMMTTKNQQQIIYTNRTEDIDRKTTLDYGIGFMNWESTYYGIGLNNSNDIQQNYDLKQARAFIGFKKELDRNSSLRLAYNTYKNEIKGLSSDLISDDLKSLISGFEVNYYFDRIDSRINPKNGYKLNFSIEFYDEMLGSDLNFQKNLFDLKIYKELNEKSLLAFQYSIESSNGDIPFYEMYSLGSSMMIRGYLAGRYIDKNFTGLQAEYKHYLNKKWIASIFGGVGAISDNIKGIYKEDMKKAVGFGVRYVFSEEENVKMRFDIGVNEDGSTAIYIMFSEAL